MIFGTSALNRVYDFKQVCPGPVLDRVWLQVVKHLEIRNQRCLSVVIFINNALRQLTFSFICPK